MTNSFESSAAVNDKAAQPSISDQSGSTPLVDMADRSSMQGLFKPQNSQDNSVISDSGQLMFSNPYERHPGGPGHHKAYGEHEDKGEHCGHGGQNETADSTQPAPSDSGGASATTSGAGASESSNPTTADSSSLNLQLQKDLSLLNVDIQKLQAEITALGGSILTGAQSDAAATVASAPAQSDAAAKVASAPAQSDAAATVASAPAQSDAAATVASAPAQSDAAATVASAPAQSDAAATVASAPAQSDAAATVASAPAQGDAAATVASAPAQSDAAATVASAPAQSDAAATVASAPAQSDAAATVASAPAQSDAAATVASAPAQSDAAAQVASSATDNGQVYLPSDVTQTFDSNFANGGISQFTNGSDRLGNTYLAGNGEQERYNVANATVGSDGILHMTVTDNGNGTYGSGEVVTKDFQQNGGIFDMNAKLPAGGDTWPAFWMLPSGNGWPPEVDALEALGNGESDNGQKTPADGWVHIANQGDANHNGSAGEWTQIKDANGNPVNLTTSYNDYEVAWKPGQSLTYYVDGQQVGQYTQDVPNQPMYLLANDAVGGTWGGTSDLSGAVGQEMDVASIKAWQYNF